MRQVNVEIDEIYEIYDMLIEPVRKRTIDIVGSKSLETDINSFWQDTVLSKICRSGEGDRIGEFASAIGDQANLIELPAGNHYFEDILDALPEGSRLRNFKCVRDLIPKLFNLSSKAVGKGEVALAVLLAAAEKAGKHVDLAVRQGGTVKKIEVKAENASCKATDNSSFRAIDKQLDRLWPDAPEGRTFAGIQFWDNDLQKVEEYLRSVYVKFDQSRIDDMLLFYENTSHMEIAERKEERKKHLGCHILEMYQKLDEFDIMLVLRTRKDGHISVLALNDLSDFSFVKKHLSLRPQSKRGGGTQAVGDGYCDLILR